MPVLSFDVLHNPWHSMHVLLDRWCTCRSLPVHVLLDTWCMCRSLPVHLLIGTSDTLTARYSCTCCLVPDTRYPCKFFLFPYTRTALTHARAAWYLMHGLYTLLDTWCTDCMDCLIPDVRTAWTARYLMHVLHVTHARSAWFLMHKLHITRPWTCCLIPDARTAYYPPMHVLLNWCTDCILPAHARAA
jgi:hypothetical protein